MANDRRRVIDSTLAELALVLVFVFAMVAAALATPSAPPPPTPSSKPERPERIQPIETYRDIIRRLSGRIDQLEDEIATLTATTSIGIEDLIVLFGKTSSCLFMFRDHPLSPSETPATTIVKNGVNKKTLIERSLLVFRITDQDEVIVTYNLALPDEKDATKRKHFHPIDSVMANSLLPQVIQILETDIFGPGSLSGATPRRIQRRASISQMIAWSSHQGGTFSKIKALGRTESQQTDPLRIPCTFYVDVETPADVNENRHRPWLSHIETKFFTQ